MLESYDELCKEEEKQRQVCWKVQGKGNTYSNDKEN